MSRAVRAGGAAAIRGGPAPAAVPPVPPAARPGTPGRRLARELAAFGVVGGLAFVIDLGTFQVLYGVLGTGAVTAKLLSTVTATTVAYLGHRYWSFASRQRSGVPGEYGRFALVNAATLLLGLAVVALVRYPLGQDGALVLQVANVASIVLGTVLRYLLYRWWVFPAATTTG